MGKWTYKKPASDAGKRRKKNRLAFTRQAVWDGIKSLTRNKVNFTCYFCVGCNRGRAFGSYPA